VSSQDTNSMQRSSHVLKNTSVFLRTRGFKITCRFPSWSKRMQSIPFHSISLLLTSILFFHLRLSFLRKASKVLKLTRQQEICAHYSELTYRLLWHKKEKLENMAIFVTRRESTFFTVISETAVGREKYICNTQGTNLKLMNSLSSAWLKLQD
jgi:hypothetical protein